MARGLLKNRDMKTHILLVMALFSTACGPVLPLENPFPAHQASSQQKSSVPNPLHISVLDVGQGDSTLIVGPTGKTLLIDAGKTGEGVMTVLPDLEALSIDHLNWILATHYDADHIGGIAEVLKGADQILGTEDDQIPTDAVIDRGDETDKSTATYQNYVDIAQPYRTEAAPGQIFELGDGASAEVIVVDGRYSDGRSIPLTPDEENEACIGLLIRSGRFK